MPDYVTTARKWRPKNFKEVIGQEQIVITLKNAIRYGRLAHAYLFCGSRGTGKTTLARVFAKALVCAHPDADLEPCNQCSACCEVTNGSSLDVLEIDGASHRGIDDVRQINETVGYAPASGKYKIYIIDEVHMLTKEAFNALLKTLEEPPPKVIFFFATTEPHKVPPTILSRCQRFNLNRISTDKIVAKLRHISQSMLVDIDEECLRLIALHADGGLRDAESLFDQILAFHTGKIDAASVADVLGVVPKAVLFELDAAGKAGDYAKAFEIAEGIFSQGKDLVHFVEMLIEHYRNLLLIKCAGIDAPFLSLSDEEKSRYVASAAMYSQEMCLTNLEMLTETLGQIRFSPTSRIALESVLLNLIRSHQRIPIDFLIRKLAELEAIVQNSQVAAKPLAQVDTQSQPQLQDQPQKEASLPSNPNAGLSSLHPVLLEDMEKPKQNIMAEPPKEPSAKLGSVSVDPTPTAADLGKKISAVVPAKVATQQYMPKESSFELFTEKNTLTNHIVMPIESNLQNVLANANPENEAEKRARQTRYQTLLQFASVILDGSLQIKSINLF